MRAGHSGSHVIHNSSNLPMNDPYAPTARIADARSRDITALVESQRRRPLERGVFAGFRSTCPYALSRFTKSMRTMFFAVAMLASAAVQAQGFTCPGFTLGRDTRDTVIAFMQETATAFSENTDGLRCKRKSTVIVTTDAMFCDGLPGQPVGAGVMIDHDSGKAVAATFVYAYDYSLHAQLHRRLKQQYDPIRASKLPPALRRLLPHEELTGAFRGSNLTVWLLAPSLTAANGAAASTVVYALPEYVEMARTDPRQCE
jgi:hypothetical protein